MFLNINGAESPSSCTANLLDLQFFLWKNSFAILRWKITLPNLLPGGPVAAFCTYCSRLRHELPLMRQAEYSARERVLKNLGIFKCVRFSDFEDRDAAVSHSLTYITCGSEVLSKGERMCSLQTWLLSQWIDLSLFSPKSRLSTGRGKNIFLTWPKHFEKWSLTKWLVFMWPSSQNTPL